MILEEGLLKLEIPEAERVSSLLQKYIEEIELFNPSYGLVKVQNKDELIIKHILDSLSPLIIIERLLNETNKPWQIADIGSGAGFPGIPLSICLPEAKFTLIERMGRRAGFLRNCIAVLGTGNVMIEEMEMEKALPERFDLAVFRAFRPLEPDILKGLLRLLKPKGFLAAWKGRLEKIQEEMSFIQKFFPALAWETHRLEVPFLEEERHLVIIGKPCQPAV